MPGHFPTRHKDKDTSEIRSTEEGLRDTELPRQLLQIHPYLVLKEGCGSARAITAAVVMAVMTEAEKTAALQLGGRLKRPLMAVLDGAANVVRWRELPNVDSHYGSRGIVVSTFFQFYS